MSSYNALNPIRSVKDATINNPPTVYVPVPSAYQYILSDTSSADAGRVESGKMYKERIDQIVKLELSWQNITTAAVSEILQAFNPEYLNVTFLDAYTGGYSTKEFYVGDRTSPLYNSRLGLWSNVSLNLIERGGN